MGKYIYDELEVEEDCVWYFDTRVLSEVKYYPTVRITIKHDLWKKNTTSGTEYLLAV